MLGKEKLLITGGLGNLGSWLTSYFSTKFDVYVLSKSVKNTLECNYKIIECDITNLEALKEKLTIDFDYCIHTASYNEFFHENYAKKALEVNTLGTRNLIEVLETKDIKNFIYLSTFHVYGINEGIVHEETPLTPRNDYASTHLFAEYYVKQFYANKKFPFVILRLSNSYGTPKYINSTKWYLVLNDLVKSAYKNNQIVLNSNGKAKRDFIWMEDVCSVIEKSLLFESNMDNIFNLSSGQTFSVMELAEQVQKSYLNKYNKKIEILINKNDTTEEAVLSVSNDKLLNVINHEFKNRIKNEIEAIFNLLEEGN